MSEQAIERFQSVQIEAPIFYEPLQLVSSEILPQPNFIDAAMVPEFAFVQRQKAFEGATLLEQRRENLRQAEYDQVPIPVDALGTAHEVVIAENLYGINSLEHTEKMASLVVDCRRLLTESSRWYTYEYFQPLERMYNPQTEKHEFNGLTIADMTARAITPLAEPEEVECRVGEHIEEAVYNVAPRLAAAHVLGRLGLGSTVSFITDSECPDWAINAYTSNPRANTAGYAPKVEKKMLRYVTLDIEKGKRYDEQLGIPGTYITKDVFTAVIADGGADLSDISKAGLRGRQVIDTQNSGLFSLQAKLDAKASELSGLNIFMGEAVAEDHPKDYRIIPEQARVREQETELEAIELAKFVITLEKQQTDSWHAESLVMHEVKRIMFSKVKHDSNLTALVFNQETADGVDRAHTLEAEGKHSEAKLVLRGVENNAPTPPYCGAGSCGLRAASSVEENKAQLLGLSGETLHISGVTCPECSAESVFVDYHGKKACLKCGA